MKNVIAVLAVFISSISPAFADISFMAVDQNSGQVLEQRGDLEERSSPCSTFKIALALIGIDSGILANESSPEWTITKADYAGDMDAWYGSHTPQTWLKYSVVPYSQIMTQKLGKEAFEEYVEKLEYGNKNVTGDPVKQDGLTQCWLSSSLQISPEEQIRFLDHLTHEKLPVSQTSQKVVKDMLYLNSDIAGWKLYGKTGGGRQQNAEGAPTDLKVFWFVGWVEKGNQRILFAANVKEETPSDSWPSNLAKKEAIQMLDSLLSEEDS